MTIFWILAAGLAGLALLFVIPPLLTRPETEGEPDQDQLNLAVFRQQLQELDADLEAGNLDRGQYQDARQDLERELLHDVDGRPNPAPSPAARSPLTALVLVLALPAFTFALYGLIGNSAIIPRLEAVPLAASASSPHGGGADAGPGAASLENLVERLAAKMEANPDQLEGWIMLGQTYVALDQPEKGAQALERALGLAPDNPEVMISLAQALATAANSQLAGRPAELIGAALAIEPEHPTGRWLDGLAAYQAENYALAVERWESLAQDLEAQGEDTEELRQFIADARDQGGLPAAGTETLPAGNAASRQTSGAKPATSSRTTTAADNKATSTAGPAAPTDSKAKAGSSLQVEVSLAEPLWPKADINHSLFVYAKAASGPPMPLAVKRLKVGDLPLTLTLDDSLAVNPEMSLSKFSSVIVGARISATGQASPQGGDLEGETGPLAPGDQPSVKVLIDRIRP